MASETRLNTLAGLAGVGLGVALWVIEASATPPVWLRALFGGVAIVLILPWLLAMTARLWKRWRRMRGFDALFDLEIANGLAHAERIESDPQEWEGWEADDQAMEWDRRVFTILVAYDRKFGDIFHPGSE